MLYGDQVRNQLGHQLYIPLNNLLIADNYVKLLNMFKIQVVLVHLQEICITPFWNLYGLNLFLIFIPVVKKNTPKKSISIPIHQLLWQINCQLDCNSVVHLLHVSVKDLLQRPCILYEVWCLACLLYCNLVLRRNTVQTACQVLV